MHKVYLLKIPATFVNQDSSLPMPAVLGVHNVPLELSLTKRESRLVQSVQVDGTSPTPNKSPVEFVLPAQLKGKRVQPSATFANQELSAM